MASRPAQPADRQQLCDLVEELADQLCPAVDGEFDFSVTVSAHDESIDKLQMLINLVLDSARRAVETATSERDRIAVARLREEQANTRIRALLAESRTQKWVMDEHAIVAITDLSGTITYANDNFCRISKYSREELIGQTHRIVNSGRHPRLFFVELWRTITRGGVWKGEICNRAKDGSLYWVDTCIVPYKDESGRNTKFVVMRTDITERKQAEKAMLEALEKSDSAGRAKTEFLANMSHEIRTPMTAILGYTDTMLDPDQSDSEKLNAIHTVRRNGRHLLQIINDILDISKIEAGKLEIERIRCSPVQIVSEVESLMQVRADAKNLPFKIEYIGAIPDTIESDPMRLKQILVNLIGNAIKFTEVGGVTLIARLIDDGTEAKMQYDVIDTGFGMTPEQVSRLFQTFSQADASTTRIFGGTGLGLMISKRLAEMLGGAITVESKLGEGSRFRFTVPTGPLDGVKMLDDPATAQIAQPEEVTAAKAHVASLNCRILLAEDGPDNQRLMSFFLKKAGAEVTVVENGKLAADAALAARDEANPFDAILMDMQMPVMDGYEASGLLRQKGYTGPIIALTAHAMAGDRQKCIDAGCDEYVTKPINRKRLIDVIQAMLNKTRGNTNDGNDLIGVPASSEPAP